MRRQCRQILIAWLSMITVAGQAAAQTPGSSDTLAVQLDEVLVRGTRPAATSGGAGSVSAKTDSLRLRSVPTVESVLRALPATYLRTNSRGESEVTVRGSESRQVAVLLDGVPLTYAWDGRADVSVIPALAVQEVTLVRGLSSLSAGANTLGGVVSLATLPSGVALERGTAQVRAGVYELGAYGVASTVSVPHSLSWGVFTIRGGAGYYDTPGQTLPNGIDEPVPADDNERLNTDFQETNGFVSMRIDANNGAYVSLLGTGHQAERGIAAQLGVTSARFWRYPFIARGIGVLSAGTGRREAPWGGRTEFQISSGYDLGRTEIDAYTDRSYATLDAQEDGNDNVFSLRSVATQTLGESADVRFGFSYGDIRHDEILDGIENPYRQTLWSGSAEAMMRLPGVGGIREFDLSAGTTFDGENTPKTGNKPPFEALDRWGGRLGVAAHLGDGGTSAHASVSQRARFPSLRELYSGALGSFEPNPNLKPEELLAFEAGVTTEIARGGLQVIGFHHLLSDAVVRIRPPGQDFQRVNQEGIRSVGVELQTSHAFGPTEVSVDLIAQDVKVLDPAAGLTQPENMPELIGGVRVQLPVGVGMFVAADARYTGEQFVIDPEHDVESRLAPAGQLNLDVSRAWPLGGGTGWFRGVQLRAALDNVTDAVQYDAFGLPQAGRTVRLELMAY